MSVKSASNVSRDIQVCRVISQETNHLTIKCGGLIPDESNGIANLPEEHSPKRQF